jgi:hypothetical protein
LHVEQRILRHCVSIDQHLENLQSHEFVHGEACFPCLRSYVLALLLVGCCLAKLSCRHAISQQKNASRASSFLHLSCCRAARTPRRALFDQSVAVRIQTRRRSARAIPVIRDLPHRTQASNIVPTTRREPSNHPHTIVCFEGRRKDPKKAVLLAQSSRRLAFSILRDDGLSVPVFALALPRWESRCDGLGPAVGIIPIA